MHAYRKRCSRLAMLWLLCVVPMFAAGCSFLAVKTPEPGRSVVYALPPDTKTEIVLYVPDLRVGKITEIEREIVLQGEELYLALLRGLIGAEFPEIRQGFFAAGTRLLSQPQLDGGVLYLNFSREIKNAHPASAAAETTLLKALIYTLTQDPSVEAVQLLVDSRKADTLLGYAEVGRPLGRADFGEDAPSEE